MTRGKDKGDPSTVAGEFPSELGGGGSGGGGGGGTSSPVQLSESMALSEAGGFTYGGGGAVALDNRRIGGSLYGVYIHQSDYPFEGSTYGYSTSIAGANNMNVANTATITGSPILGAVLTAYIYNGTGGVLNSLSLRFRGQSITNEFFSPAIDGYNTMFFNSFTGLSVPTTDYMRVNIDIPLGVPGPFYEYAFGPYLNYIKGGGGVGNTAALYNRRRHRYMIPQGSETFTFSAYIQAPQSLQSANMSVRWATANPTPNLSAVSYPTYS